MKKLKYQLVFLLVIVCHSAAITQVFFTYDVRGNRVNRVLTLSKVSDTIVQDETITHKFDNTLDTDTIAELVIGISPNPTKSSIIISVSKTNVSDFPVYSLFNLQGEKIIGQKELSSNANLINLSNEANGVYFLVVNYKTHQRTWKIIKE